MQTSSVSEIIYFRFDPNPESGTSKGLTLILDAKTHLITASSITDYAQEK